MNNDKKQGARRGQVSLTQKATAARRRRKKKTEAPIGKIVLAVLGVGLLIAFIFFGVAAYNFVMTRFFGGSSSGGDELPPPYEGKDATVAYYLFGMFGEDETQDLEMLSLVCYDKVGKTVNVMQIPTSTYLGDTEKFTVPTIGGVWANPKPLDWCETCRRAVYAGEILDGRHDANTETGGYCGAPVTQKTGSAQESLFEVFNHQYTIAPDNFYLMPQGAFVDFVNQLGGVDIELEYGMTLGDTDYPAGVQTLGGEAALEYVLGDATTVDGELDNLLHQRQVYAALFERLFLCNHEQLDDVMWYVMNWEHPVRTRRDNIKSDDIDLMIALVEELATLPRENIAVYLMPGQAATADGAACYSVHKDELAELLNEAFNPGGQPIAEEHLKMEELLNTYYCDLHHQTMAELLVTQQGQLPDEEG